jgi:hypothetical protein
MDLPNKTQRYLRASAHRRTARSRQPARPRQHQDQSPRPVAMCYVCNTQPAGSSSGGPVSAYCDTCQPVDTRPQPKGAECRCARCGHTFSGIMHFDAHVTLRPAVGCRDPRELGLVQGPTGTWCTPGELSRRQHAAQNLSVVNDRRKAASEAA